MAHLKMNLQRLALLTLIAMLCLPAFADEAADNTCTIDLTIDSYMAIDIVDDGIVMTTVASNWFGETYNSTGTSDVNAWTNVNARMTSPATLTLVSVEDNEITVLANISYDGVNQAYVHNGGWAIDFDPGAYVNETSVMVSTGLISWQPGVHLAGEYTAVLTLTLEAR